MNGILYINTRMFEDKELFRKGMEMIPTERREKISQFKNPVPARLSLGAGVLLQILLERNGLSDKAEEIKTGEHGKPYLQDTDLHFSLSHSGEYAICAYSAAPIGADLQKIKENIPVHTKRILSAEESLFLNSMNEAEKNTIFYRLWARKESLIKWDGRGLRLPMQEVSFVKDGQILDSLIFENNRLYFKEYVFSGYALCVCNEKNAFCTNLEEITSKFLTKY